MTVRNARISNPEEKTADELSKQVLSDTDMEKHIQNRENVEQKYKTKALSMIKKVFEDTSEPWT